MSEEIIITGTPIAFPSTAQSPDWSPAIIQFAELTADALSSLVGTFDVVPQRFIIDTVPNATPTAITNLSFSTTNVRGAFITYTVYRHTTSVTVAETGNLMIVYNESNSVGEKWEMTRDSVGSADVDFTIEDTGQIDITLNALAGSSHTGFISYQGKALQDTY